MRLVEGCEPANDEGSRAPSITSSMRVKLIVTPDKAADPPRSNPQIFEQASNSLHPNGPRALNLRCCLQFNHIGLELARLQELRGVPDLVLS